MEEKIGWIWKMAGFTEAFFWELKSVLKQHLEASHSDVLPAFDGDTVVASGLSALFFT